MSDHMNTHSQEYPRIFAVMRSISKRLLLILLAVLMAGCGAEDLYTNVTESDANTMLGLLIARGISATKRPVKENLFAVAVPRDQFASAVDILKWYGIPKETFDGIGEMFPKTGLVSSPSEERIRFMHALAGNISEMLSNIDGVITARVILVLPSNDPYTNKNNPASASVFLKIRPGFDTTTQIPQIKQLVMNSVEGLNYDKVAVTLVRSDEVDFFNPLKAGAQQGKILGISVNSESRGALVAVLIAAFLLVLGSAGAAVYFFLKFRKGAQGSAASTESIEPPVAG
jgi:type III secretion protein J